MKLHLRMLAVLALSITCAAARANDDAASGATPVIAQALKPVPKQDEKFLKMHQSFLDRAKSGPIGLLFIGDSITQNWQSKAPDIWEAYYGQYQPANFGIGGDGTQHILWRIENGELDNIHPKVVVLLAGTNNTANSSADDISAAEKKIVDTIRLKLPDTKILLLGILPRGPRTGKDGIAENPVKRMEIIASVNATLAKFDDGKNIRYLDIGDKFLDADGKIPMSIMQDQLHPSAAGYQVFADALKPTLDKMLR